MDKEENRSLFHVTFDKEQALYLLRKLLTYGVYVEAYVKDKTLWYVSAVQMYYA